MLTGSMRQGCGWDTAKTTSGRVQDLQCHTSGSRRSICPLSDWFASSSQPRSSQNRKAATRSWRWGARLPLDNGSRSGLVRCPSFLFTDSNIGFTGLFFAVIYCGCVCWHAWQMWGRPRGVLLCQHGSPGNGANHRVVICLFGACYVDRLSSGI